MVLLLVNKKRPVQLTLNRPFILVNLAIIDCKLTHHARIYPGLAALVLHLHASRL